jgi:hypothetical protein
LQKDVRSESLSSIAAKIGGFSSFVLKLAAFVGPVFMTIALYEIARHIQSQQPTGSKESLVTIVANMKERLSYLGFYNLFDRVKTLENENQELKVQVKLNLELQKDNQEVKKEHKEMQAQIKMLLDTIQKQDH